MDARSTFVIVNWTPAFILFMDESFVMLITFESPEPNSFSLLPALGMMLPLVWNGKYKSRFYGLLTSSTNRMFR